MSRVANAARASNGTRRGRELVGVLLYTGADAVSMQGRRFNLTGRRCFSGQYGPHARFTPDEASEVTGLLDSGAFSDAPERRLTPQGALERQLNWERKAVAKWGREWQAEAFVSYDLLIDEKWANGKRRKERWSIHEAERAVRVTVEAASFLASQRDQLRPRSLVLACQGVDHFQYYECAAEVIRHARPGDWLGLGGWCILGRFTSWLPQFFATLNHVLPLASNAGLSRVHIFGVMYPPALGPYLWLADQLGLTVSTDSSKPAMDTTRKNPKKAGQREATWEKNVAWWDKRLAGLRATEHYRPPANPDLRRQLLLWP